MRRIIQILGIIALLGLFHISLQAQFDAEYTMSGLWEQRFIEFGGEEKAYFISRSENSVIQYGKYPIIQLEYIASKEFGDIEICYTPLEESFNHTPVLAPMLMEDYRIGEDVCETIPNPDYEEPQLMLHASDIFGTYEQTNTIPEGTEVFVSTIRPLTERPISFVYIDSSFRISQSYRLDVNFHEEYQFGYHGGGNDYIEYYGTWRAVYHPNALFGFYLESVSPNNRIHFYAQDYYGDLLQTIIYRTVGGRYGDGTSQAEMRVCVSETPDNYGNVAGLYETECMDVDNDAPFENYYQPIVISHSQMPSDAMMNINITALRDIPITIDGILVGDSHIPNRPLLPTASNLEYIGEWEVIPLIDNVYNNYYFSDDPEAKLRMTSNGVAVLYMNPDAHQVGDIEFCAMADGYTVPEFCRYISQEVPYDIVFGGVTSQELEFRNIGNGIHITGTGTRGFKRTLYHYQDGDSSYFPYWEEEIAVVAYWEESSINYGTEDEPLILNSAIVTGANSVIGLLFKGSGFIIHRGPQSTGTLRVCLDTEYQDTCQLVNLDDLADPNLSRFGLDNTTTHELRIYLVDGIFDFVGFEVFE